MKKTKILTASFLLTFTFLSSFSAAYARAFEDKKIEFGLAPGLLFSGDVYISLLGGKVTQQSNFLLRSYVDAYVIPQIAFGLYFNYSSLNLENDLEIFGKEIKKSGTSIIGVGGTIKPKFIISPTVAIKPGFSIGHRQFFGDNEFSKWKGLGLNGSCEIQYLLPNQLVLFGETGFLYQPYGGNEDTDVTFDPIFYFVLGIAI
jgi:hypothetical protein